jgi:autotransporter-associated beta strand protein
MTAACGFAFLSAAVAPSANAQAIYTWGNAATDFNANGSWTTAGVPGAADRAFFTSAASVQPQLTASATVSQLSFGTSGYTVGASAGSSTLQLNSTSATATSAAIYSNGNNTIAANLVLGSGNKTIATAAATSQDAGSGLRLTGTITGGNASDTLTFTSAAAGRITGIDGTANTFASTPVIGGGSVEVARLGDTSGGGAASLGTSTTIRLQAGQLRYSGAGETTNRSLDVLSNVRFVSSPTSGLLVVTGSISTSTAGAKQLIIQPLASGTNSSTIEIQGLVSDGAGTVSLHAGPTGANIVRLTNNANSFTGGVSIRGATLQTAVIGTAGANSPLGTSGTVQFGSTLGSIAAVNRLSYTGTGETTNKVMLNGIGATNQTGVGLVIEQAGSGVLELTADIASDQANFNRFMRLEGSTSGTGRMSGLITNNGTGIVSLSKQGTGTWILGNTNTYSGTTTVSNGVLALGTNNALGSGAVTLAGGTLALAGYTDSVGPVTLSSGAITGDAGGVLTSTAGFDVHSGSVSAVLAGNVGLTKSTGGLVTLSGSNTYTGATSVSGGDLRVNGSIAAASSVNVAAAGTLSGTGTINGVTAITGTHSPGNVVGVQTFNADLTYSGGSIVNWDLIANSTGGSGISDQVAVPTGNLTFSGSTGLNLAFNGSGSTVAWSDAFWANDRSWLLYDLSTGVTNGIGDFSINTQDWLDSTLAPLSASRPDASFAITQLGQDVYITYVAVPEPAAGVLAIFAVAGLAASRSFRRKQSA